MLTHSFGLARFAIRSLSLELDAVNAASEMLYCIDVKFDVYFLTKQEIRLYNTYAVFMLIVFLYLITKQHDIPCKGHIR